MNVNQKKEAQGYKTTPETCANCKNFSCREYHFRDVFYPFGNNTRGRFRCESVKVEGRGPWFSSRQVDGRYYIIELKGNGPWSEEETKGGRIFQNYHTTAYRCGLGGFAVKKLATCKKWQPKDDEK